MASRYIRSLTLWLFCYFFPCSFPTFFCYSFALFFPFLPRSKVVSEHRLSCRFIRRHVPVNYRDTYRCLFLSSPISYMYPIYFFSPLYGISYIRSPDIFIIIFLHCLFRSCVICCVCVLFRLLFSYSSSSSSFLLLLFSLCVSP